MAKTNGRTGQLTGPFTANTEIMSLIKLDASNEVNAITKIGIQSKRNHFIRLDGVAFQLGDSGILEFEDTALTSIRFSQNEDYNTIIDYCYE